VKGISSIAVVIIIITLLFDYRILFSRHSAFLALLLVVCSLNCYRCCILSPTDIFFGLSLTAIQRYTIFPGPLLIVLVTE
jgi:hypothetical protein